MKTIYISTLMITAMLMLVLPLCAKTVPKLPTSALPQTSVPAATVPKETSVRVKLTQSGEIKTFTLEDYLFGVLAAEMPALYEKEALKAQTVAAYTYFLRKYETGGAKDYDISDDYTVDQAFITPQTAREKWGSSADEYENKLRGAVSEVLYKKLTYEGVTASTVYHAISGGVTENAAEIWGGNYPYLISADSSFDKSAENYLTTVSFTHDEIKDKLSSVGSVEDSGTNCFSEIVRTSAGSVKSLKVGGNKISGADLRKTLGLRSADFDVAFENGKYTFTVRGYGHGIGMSQYGANCMAKQGKNYEQILLHYYSGCKIE